MARAVQKATPKFKPNARAAVVPGANHETYVLKARVEANKRIVVISHRLGAVATPAIVVPLSRAFEDRAIATEVIYGRRTQPAQQGLPHQA